MDFSRVGINIAVENESFLSFKENGSYYSFCKVKSNMCSALPIISDPKSTFDAVPLESVANSVFSWSNKDLPF